MGHLSTGVFHQPIVGEYHSGDDYIVLDFEDYFLVAVVDGLGHGPDAQTAAKRAIEHIQKHPERAVQVLLEGCHEALRGTRGAVVAIARVDRSRKMLSHAGLGNIETRLVGKDKVRRPVTVNGIVGHSARKFRVEEFPFEPGDLLLMHTDGLSDRFEISSASRSRDPQMLANQLAQEHGRIHDDQLIVVVRDEA